MTRARLRAVGGSVMVAVPRPLLDQVDADIGTEVDLSIDNGRIVIAPVSRPRYTLEALLAQCSFEKGLSPDERAWMEDSPTGDELL